MEQLDYCVNDLGLKQLQTRPVYQQFDPQDRKYLPLFKKCEQFGLPVMWYVSTTFPSRSKLNWGVTPATRRYRN